MKKIKTIDAVREFFLECPFINKNSKLCVDFLSNNKVDYSIEPVPIKRKTEEYIDGGYQEQFVFNLVCRFDWNDEVINNIENSSFFETMCDWLDECTDNDILPKLDDNYTPISIEALTSGYLFDVASDYKTARYQIQCRFLFEKEVD